MESKDSREDAKEEIVGNNILPELVEFMNGKKFCEHIVRFCEGHLEAFLPFANQHNEHKDSRENGMIELTHEHKAIFDEYQEMLENLFESFAKEHRMSVSSIFSCCRNASKLAADPLYTASP